MISQLPVAPQRTDDPEVFAQRADALVAALATFVAEANQLLEDAETAAELASLTANADEWVSGQSYSVGDVVWSPANMSSYRRIVAGAGTTDPSADATNWALLAAYQSYATLSTVQTLLNKTLDSPVLNTPTLNTATVVNLLLTGKIREDVYELTGTDLNPANGTIQYKALSADTELTESLASGEYLQLHLYGGDTWVTTWPTITWIGNTEPTTTANDIVVMWKVNTTLYGAYVGAFV